MNATTTVTMKKIATREQVVKAIVKKLKQEIDNVDDFDREGYARIWVDDYEGDFYMIADLTAYFNLYLSRGDRYTPDDSWAEFHSVEIDELGVWAADDEGDELEYCELYGITTREIERML